MAAYYLGADVGSSKSQVAIADPGGVIHALVTGDGANPEEVGYDGLADTLRGLIRKALKNVGIEKGMIAGAGLGIGGYDWPSQKEALDEAIQSLELAVPTEVVNDALLAVAAGASDGWGVGVVAGTSCNAWGWDRDGRTGRMTGYAWLGEAAGGQELIEKAQQAVAREWTRRGPKTRLTQLFQVKVGAESADDLIEGLTLGRYKLLPADAPLVFQASREGDAVALDLVRWAGQELADLAVGVVRQLKLEGASFEIVLAGSFWKGSLLLREAFESVVEPVAPGAVIVRLGAPPVIGGVCLGMTAAGVDAEQLRLTRQSLQEMAGVF